MSNDEMMAVLATQNHLLAERDEFAIRLAQAPVRAANEKIAADLRIALSLVPAPVLCRDCRDVTVSVRGERCAACSIEQLCPYCGQERTDDAVTCGSAECLADLATDTCSSDGRDDL
jgi:Zn finger protein HypA/HybF involved in hydrogenase expression